MELQEHNQFPIIHYDSKGREIYYETKGGYWVKYEYDKWNNITRFEMSNGFWREAEFDEKGNLINYNNNFIQDGKTNK